MPYRLSTSLLQQTTSDTGTHRGAREAGPHRSYVAKMERLAEESGEYEICYFFFFFPGMTKPKIYRINGPDFEASERAADPQLLLFVRVMQAVHRDRITLVNSERRRNWHKMNTKKQKICEFDMKKLLSENRSKMGVAETEVGAVRSRTGFSSTSSVSFRSRSAAICFDGIRGQSHQHIKVSH
jgi:hypothetical protein